jgi:RNA polymerase sigma factor (sigma-70 family)
VAWCPRCEGVRQAEEITADCPACERPLMPVTDPVEALYLLHAKSLRGYIRVLIASWRLPDAPVDADDVIQETFARMIGSAGPIHHPEAWLRVVARRLVLDAVRDQRRGGGEGPGEHLEAGTFRWTLPHTRPSRTERLYAGREVEQQVLATIATLPDRQRVATYLRLFQEWSQEEISDYLTWSAGKHVSASTAGVHVHKGTAKLRDAFWDWQYYLHGWLVPPARTREPIPWGRVLFSLPAFVFSSLLGNWSLWRWLGVPTWAEVWRWLGVPTWAEVWRWLALPSWVTGPVNSINAIEADISVPLANFVAVATLAYVIVKLLRPVVHAFMYLLALALAFWPAFRYLWPAFRYLFAFWQVQGLETRRLAVLPHQGRGTPRDSEASTVTPHRNEAPGTAG